MGSEDASYKILIIGDSNVGKSSVLLRYKNNEFNQNIQNTIAMDFVSKHIVVDGKTVNLKIWDTAGQDRFRTLSPSYYRNGKGAILMYDVTNRTSFERLEMWIDELNNYCNNPDVAKIVVGNKVDLPNRQVTDAEGRGFPGRHDALYAEISAKTAEGVHKCYEELTRKMILVSSKNNEEDKDKVNLQGNTRMENNVNCVFNCNWW